MVGQLTLDQHIGVRIPGGQPSKLLKINYLYILSPLKSNHCNPQRASEGLGRFNDKTHRLGTGRLLLLLLESAHNG